MFADRIEGKWIDAFCEVFERCAVKQGDTAAILSETQSRQLNVQLAELALLRLGARPFHVVVPTPRNPHPVPVRSTGASEAIGKLAPVVAALGAGRLRGRLHHRGPDACAGDAGDPQGRRAHHGDLQRASRGARAHGAGSARWRTRVRAAAKMLRGAKRMTVTSAAGTNLDVDMAGAPTVGIWGWTDKPGTLAHWPGGIVVSFPKAAASTARWCSTAATSISPSSATWRRRCGSRSRPTTSRASRARAPTPR